VDRLTPLRAPLATVALILLTLVAAARVVLGLSEVVAAGGSRAVAAARLAPNAGDAALTVCVGLLVASCFLAPEVPVRRRLALWGVALTVLSVVATAVALGLSDLAVAGWNLVWGLPDLAVPVLVGVVLLVLARPGRADQQAALPATALDPATTEAGNEDVPVVADPELEPSWSQDAAAGAVWRTAGEAARGVPAQAWGSSAEASWPTAALPAGTGGQGDEGSEPGTPGASGSITPP
jgi:hypothetical protein